MRKPPACLGCPAYDFSPSWVPDEIKPGAQIFLLCQNPGQQEEVLGRPMVGKTGQKWESTYLKGAGLSRDQVNVGNVIRCRWKGEDDLPPIASVLVKAAIRHCQAAHFTIPPETRLLVAAGDYACMALTGSTVSDGDKAGNGWRGYLKPYTPLKYALEGSTARTEGGRGIVQKVRRRSRTPAAVPEMGESTGETTGTEIVGRGASCADAAVSEGTTVKSRDLSSSPDHYWLPGPTEPLPVLITWHVARTFHQPWWILPTRRDWAKVPRILRGTWPRQPPKMAAQPPQPWPSMFTFDTEYERDAVKGAVPELHRYSMAWGLDDYETAVVEIGQHRPAWIEGKPRVVTQYAPADVRHLQALTSGWPVWDRFLIEDAVWKHAVLWSDHQHDLNFLGSLYSSFNRWKHLGASTPTLYAGLDATGLLEIDRALEEELDGDSASRRVWTDIDRPALGEFVRAQYLGIRTNPERVADAIGHLQGEVEEAGKQARSLVGWPINLGSNQQVAKRLYGPEEGIKPFRK